VLFYVLNYSIWCSNTSLKSILYSEVKGKAGLDRPWRS